MTGPGVERPSELRAVFEFLRRNWSVIAACGALMLAVGAAAALLLPARYAATTTLVLENRRPRAIVEPSTPSDDLGYVDTQILTIGSDLILGAVVRELRLQDDPEFGRVRRPLLAELQALTGLGSAWPAPGEAEERALRERAAILRLRRNSRIRRLGTSFVVEITVQSDDAGKSAAVANAVAATFVEDQRRLSTQITERANPPLTTRIIGFATPPLERSAPGPALLLLLSGLAGFGGGAAVAAVREVLDRRLRTRAAVEAATGLQCLGLVPMARPAGGGGRAARGDSAAGGPANPFVQKGGLLRLAAERPSSAFSEALRPVRSIIEDWKSLGEPLVVGFASPRVGSGCSTVAANLAALAAGVGQRTLLVDADVAGAGLTRAASPAHERPPPPPSAPAPCAGGDGVGNGQAPGQRGPLRFQPVAAAEPGAGWREPSSWLAGIIARERRDCDFIFVDLPALGASGDLRALTGPLDALVVVAEWGRAEPEHIREVLHSVRRPEGKRIAVLLNKARVTAPGAARRVPPPAGAPLPPRTAAAG